MPTIEVEINKNVYLKCYRHLLVKDEPIDIEFLYGGRDSGKSRHVAQQLIELCLSESTFQCLLIRKVLNTVRDSQFNLLKSIIAEWGLDRLFRINDSRLEIHCRNGNSFYGRGLDDVGRIKSFNNPSHCWMEEGNQITNEDFVIILTSLRSNFAQVKTFFTFNPECEGNYTDFWLWQEWFAHTTDLSWLWNKEVETPDSVVTFSARATHTTYHDNKYCSSQRKAIYESYKNSKNNAYWYQTYTLGLWGFRRTGGAFWKCFDEAIHVRDLEHLQDSTYHVVIDNNVSPYIAIQLWQIDLPNKTLMQVDELPCSHPNNSAKKSASITAGWLKDHQYKLYVYIYGDPSANARSTNDDNGLSFFDKAKAEIIEHGFQIEDRVQRSAPSIAMSGSFINDIFEKNYDGWTILINTTCRVSIEDYMMTKEASDGTMVKKRITDKQTGISYEKYGHFSDNLRYFCTTVLADEYEEYQQRDDIYISRSN